MSNKNLQLISAEELHAMATQMHDNCTCALKPFIRRSIEGLGSAVAKCLHLRPQNL
jgi:hypothetical protein